MTDRTATRSAPYPVIDHLPAMCRFMRRRMTEDARAARRSGDAVLAALVLADVRSRRELLDFVESWIQARGDDGRWSFAGDDRATQDGRYWMDAQLSMLGYAVRRLVRRYNAHPRYRPEWEGSDR